MQLQDQEQGQEQEQLLLLLKCPAHSLAQSATSLSNQLETDEVRVHLMLQSDFVMMQCGAMQREYEQDEKKERTTTTTTRRR